MSEDEILNKTVQSVKFDTYVQGEFTTNKPFSFGGGSASTPQSILEMHNKINEETSKIVSENVNHEIQQAIGAEKSVPTMVVGTNGKIEHADASTKIENATAFDYQKINQAQADKILQKIEGNKSISATVPQNSTPSVQKVEEIKPVEKPVSSTNTTFKPKESSTPPAPAKHQAFKTKPTDEAINDKNKAAAKASIAEAVASLKR